MWMLLDGINDDLDFLDALLYQTQMGGFKAVESTEGPDAGMIFVWIFVSAFFDFCFDLCAVLSLAELLDQSFNIESGGVSEQSHFF